MTADFRSLYPHHAVGDPAVRLLTRARTASRYERAQVASAALAARVRATRRARRPETRPAPQGIPTTADPLSPLRERVRRQQRATDIAAARSSQQFIKTLAARLEDGVRERAMLDLGREPAPVPKAQHAPQQLNPRPTPGPQNNPGRS